MKKKKTLGANGRKKKKNVRYTDEYIEDYDIEDYDTEDYDTEDYDIRDYEEDHTDAQDSDEDEYIVAYSSENAVVGTYTSEEMQSYEDEVCDERRAYEDEEAYDASRAYEDEEAYEDPQGDESEDVYDASRDEQQVYEDEAYDEPQDYETEEYEEQQSYEDEEYLEQRAYEDEAYEEPQDYETQAHNVLQELEDGPQAYEDEEAYDRHQEYDDEAYEPEESGESDASVYATREINIEIYMPEDFAEDTESYYENVDEEEGTVYDDSDAHYDDVYYDDEFLDDDYDDAYYDTYEAYDEDSFEIAYGDYDAGYEEDAGAYDDYDDLDDDYDDYIEEPLNFWQKVKSRLGHLTAFDAVLALTGVVVLVAAFVILNMFWQSRQVDEQIEALAPLGTELKEMGIVGSEGLAAMEEAALAGNFAQTEESETEETSSVEVVETPQSTQVSVNFESVERDLKIRFTDVRTGELIRGTAFEVVMTNSKGKQLILTDDDMDGIIYAQNVNAGIFDAVVTSTDKYKFPTVAQQVTVKDKVEYIVINVQDEVKTEKQVNVAAEDTEQRAAVVEEEVLKDTVEWVESTKTPVSGSESYLLVDKNTIADPSQVSKAAARMLFDTLNVSLDRTEATMMVGSSIDLKGTEFTNSKEGDIEYQYTIEWKSSDENIASVSGGKVTAKAAGSATITYTVTRKTITTTTETKEPVEELKEISVEEYEALSDEEKGKCTPNKNTNENGEEQITGYVYKKVTQQEPETKTSETVDSAYAECKITVEAAKITSGSLELSKSADSCEVGATLTVKPAKLVYTKQDGSTETLTENFPAIAWASEDTAIATVESDGVVKGVKAGKTHITGRVTGVSGADGKELDIRCSVEVSITGGGELTVSLDRTGEVYLAVGGSTTLVATVSNYKSDAGVTWETSDAKVATVDEKGVVTGVSAGSVKITATTKEKDAQDKPRQATCVVTINSNASADTTTKLKDKNGNQIYVKNADGSYREAVYADYYSSAEFYITAQANYVYTGWQTIEGKTYYYDKNGAVVTGTQIIQGVTYNFGEDGAIATKVNGSTFGIDISRHNGAIDWNAVKASGVDYVIIRCGYRGSATGVLIEDQNFRTNIKGATAAGLKVGVYVFSQAVDEVEAVKEASLAVSLVKGYNLTYPIFIDTEASGGRADKIDKATRTAVVNAFCQTVASAGYQPGIYASKSWYEDKLNMSAVASCRIWLAQYASAPTYKGKYDMWQYSKKGTISGIKGDVDLNYSYTGY